MTALLLRVITKNHQSSSTVIYEVVYGIKSIYQKNQITFSESKTMISQLTLYKPSESKSGINDSK